MKISFLGGVQKEEGKKVESPPSSSGASSSPVSFQTSVLICTVKQLEARVAELEFALGLSEGVVTSQEGNIAYLLLKIEQLNATIARLAGK